MRYYTLLVAMLPAVCAFAQKKPVAKPAKPADYALIRGHINNNQEAFLDYGAADYLNFPVASIAIDKQGNFSKKIKIDAPLREIYIETGTGMMLPLKANDTVDLEWDAHNFDNTITIKTSDPAEAAQFKKAFQQRLFSQKSNGMRRGIYEPQKTDSAKFEEINDFYNEEIAFLLKDNAEGFTPKMAIDIYFDYCHLLQSQGLLPKYELYLKKPIAKSELLPWLAKGAHYKPYMMESEEYFTLSPKYRDFLFDHIRFRQAFNARSVINGDNNNKTAQWSPPLTDYYSGMAAFNIFEMRDWFITRSIMMDFEHYSFADATIVYNDFMTKVKTQRYADTLKAYYANIQRLKPGSPAPIFTLKNEAGKTVSLSDFKGKVVYIDFWGVGCGPCVYAIKNEVPALHENYKDKDIVFVNICVDSNEEQWKQSLKDLKLTGINLHAEGWTKHPVCNAYNINAIPHYYLLDKQGKIANNNAGGASKYVYPELDKLLK